MVFELHSRAGHTRGEEPIIEIFLKPTLEVLFEEPIVTSTSYLNSDSNFKYSALTQLILVLFLNWQGLWRKD